MKNKGLRQYRFSTNPMEKRFAEVWEEHNKNDRALQYILSDDNVPVYPTEREKEIAATIIQWLGTPVGQGFLSEVGFFLNQPLGDYMDKLMQEGRNRK